MAQRVRRWQAAVLCSPTHAPDRRPAQSRTGGYSGGGEEKVSVLARSIILPVLVLVCIFLAQVLQDRFGWTFWHATAAVVPLAILEGLVYARILKAMGKRQNSN